MSKCSQFLFCGFLGTSRLIFYFRDNESDNAALFWVFAIVDARGTGSSRRYHTRWQDTAPLMTRGNRRAIWCRQGMSTSTSAISGTKNVV